MSAELSRLKREVKADVKREQNITALAQKDQEGKRIMMKMAKPRKPSKNNPAVWHEDPEDFQKLYEYWQKFLELQIL